MNTNKMNYKVAIRCMTFNHKPYIRQCLDGFVMQKTNFPFVAIVVDDASTDNEQEVLWDFINNELDATSLQKDESDDYIRVIATHKTNKNCTFVFILLKYNHYSIRKAKRPYYKDWDDKTKYIAICEGDDYWTHPLKLQKQVEFLEEHEDYSCCCHRFKIYYENTDTWTDDFGGRAFAKYPNAEGIEVTNSENFRTRFTSTLTLCFRKSVYDSIVWPPYKFGGRDFNLHYHLLKQGKGWCFADYMGVYRKNNGGIWSRLSNIKCDKIRLECYEDLYKYNPKDNDILENYNYWLDNFYGRHVRPFFSEHRSLKEGTLNLYFYVKHCFNAKSYIIPLKRTFRCLTLLLGVK